MAVTVRADDGICRDEDHEIGDFPAPIQGFVCRVVRATSPASGPLVVEARGRESTERLMLAINGAVGLNPLTMTVTAGERLKISVGIPIGTVSQTITVTTRFANN